MSAHRQGGANDNRNNDFYTPQGAQRAFGGQQREIASLSKLIQQSQAKMNAAYQKPKYGDFQVAGKAGDAGNFLANAPGYNLESQTDTRFLDQMRDQGLRSPGQQSMWRKLQGQQLTADAAGQAAQVQAQNSQVMNQMAMRGGVSRGARERMGNQANVNSMRASQNVLGQKYGLDLQDEQMRQQQLGQLGQAEMGIGAQKQGVGQFNITNRLNELLQQRKFEADKSMKQLEVWGAEKTAAATPSSGGGKK